MTKLRELAGLALTLLLIHAEGVLASSSAHCPAGDADRPDALEGIPFILEAGLIISHAQSSDRQRSNSLCTERWAAWGWCGKLSDDEKLNVDQAIEANQDCDLVRAQLRRANAKDEIRVVDRLPRSNGSYAIATTKSGRVIIIARDHQVENGWDVAGLAKILGHEVGHRLFPNGAIVSHVQYDSEEMAQSHGSCFKNPRKI